MTQLMIQQLQFQQVFSYIKKKRKEKNYVSLMA